jgi:hypothetical protein
MEARTGRDAGSGGQARFIRRSARGNAVEYNRVGEGDRIEDPAGDKSRWKCSFLFMGST